MATKRLHYINDPEHSFTVRSTGEKVEFYHWDDDRAYRRVKWVDRIGFEYVRLNNAFQALSRQRLHNGMQITVGEYR